MGQAARLGNSIKIVSLLQPPPETVALFDEVILLDRGRVIFAGPIDEVVARSLRGCGTLYGLGISDSSSDGSSRLAPDLTDA